MWQRNARRRAARPAIAPGGQFGPYRLLEEIGRGGSAVVYHGVDPAHGRDVALKIVAPGFAVDPSFTARFRQEAELVARLRHEHILAIFDSGEVEGDPPDAPGGFAYLVTEYMPQGSLAARLAALDALGGTAARCELAVEVAAQIGAALDYAHLAGVLHRDVKPSNVLIAADGRLVLSDFGLARVLQEGASLYLTASGLVAGTPAYMAPEQALGEPADASADLYGLAVVLYEIIAGRVPFHAETPLATMLAHVHQPPPPPREVRPDTPAEVEAVLVRALAKRRQDRFQTGAELAAELRTAAVAAYGEAALVTGTLPRVVPDPAPSRPQAGVPPVVVPVRARQRPLAAVAAAQAAVRRSRGPAVLLRTLAAATGFVSVLLLLGGGGAAVARGPGRPLVADLLARLAAIPLAPAEPADSPEPTEGQQTDWTEAYPPNNARDWPLQHYLFVRFSRPMDADSVENALHLEPPVQVDLAWEGQSLVITPRQALQPSTHYSLVIEASARDVEGRPLARPLIRQFTTTAVGAPLQSPGEVQAAPAPLAPIGPDAAATAAEPRPITITGPAAAPARAAPGPTAPAPTAPSSVALPQPTLYAPPTVPPLGPDQSLVAGHVEAGDAVPTDTPAPGGDAAPATATSAASPSVPAASTTPTAAGQAAPTGTPTGAAQASASPVGTAIGSPSPGASTSPAASATTTRTAAPSATRQPIQSVTPSRAAVPASSPSASAAAGTATPPGVGSPGTAGTAPVSATATATPPATAATPPAAAGATSTASTAGATASATPTAAGT